MADLPIIETERLRLRPIDVTSDLDGFAELMADPASVRYIGNRVMDRVGTWRHIAMILGHWQMRGYGLFSVIEKASGAWVGRIGPWGPLGWPQPEVGWAIHPAYLRRGFGAEAASACVKYAFEILGWDEVIHVIHCENLPSMKLAEAIGSVRDGELPNGIPGVTSERCWVFRQRRR